MQTYSLPLQASCQHRAASSALIRNTTFAAVVVTAAAAGVLQVLVTVHSVLVETLTSYSSA